MALKHLVLRYLCALYSLTDKKCGEPGLLGEPVLEQQSEGSGKYCQSDTIRVILLGSLFSYLKNNILSYQVIPIPCYFFILREGLPKFPKLTLTYESPK